MALKKMTQSEGFRHLLTRRTVSRRHGIVCLNEKKCPPAPFSSWNCLAFPLHDWSNCPTSLSQCLNCRRTHMKLLTRLGMCKQDCHRAA
ncbi:hypothetical protein BDZ85DRAFT_254410 [Elsinoe ampelina]|uniref:Uncharacterized protein n=1 Tax=Elsinoe ampelina TaxID=302913 RepID=A0A6A6GPA4_9PEZI|nr:hypothetical protein BDZ85DRAFT_254410 [Elsinoe ampelina]